MGEKKETNRILLSTCVDVTDFAFRVVCQQECVSCCDYSYCNQEVPVNRSTALQLSSFTAASTSPGRTLRSDRQAVAVCVLTAVLWYGSFRDLLTSSSSSCTS